jgi:phospholipid/cholesterol/gamma-HCH transport system substrate-binding protein
VQKQTPTLGRLLVMVGFALSCFGLLLFLWLAFGGSIPLAPKGYRFTTSFGEATQLAKEADVRISGVSVGKVKDIETQSSGRSKATIELEEKYAPLPKDSKAILRQKSLLGETYVELTPGDKASGSIPENGTLPASQVSPTVELDEIFRAFDAKTRDAFRVWMQSQAASLSGRGVYINQAIGSLPAFATNTTDLLKILNAQQADVRGVVRDTGVVFDALTARDSELAQLIQNSNNVFETTAARDQDLKQLFQVLPTFNTESTKTLVALDAFAHNANPVVTALHPAAQELSPTLEQLALTAPDLQALIRVSKTGIPALTGFLEEFRPFLGEVDQPLRQLNPILRFLGDYSDLIRTFFANTVAATEAFDRPAKATGPVHYLRTLNPINPENLAQYPNRIGSNRTNPYEFPKGYLDLANGGRFSVETRQCGRGDPTIQPNPDNPNALLRSIFQFAFGYAAGATTGQVVAPPCKEQAKYKNHDGTSTQFPHVTADPNGSTARAKGAGRP